MTEPTKRPAPKAKVKATATTPPQETLDAVVEALTASTLATTTLIETTERLTTTLEQTDQTNRDTRRWRRIASVVGVVAIGAVFALVFQWREESRDRDARQAEEIRQAEVEAEARSLGACRIRNESQHHTRTQIGALIDAVDSLGVSQLTPLVTALRESQAGAPADRDCDGDGVVTTADYPPVPVASR